MTGMVALPEANKFITVSDQGQVIVAAISTGEELQSFCPLEWNRHALKSLIELPERKSIVATDHAGHVYIWSYEPEVELTVKLDLPTKEEVRGLQVINNMLCVGQIDGLVTLYDMGAPGKEKFTKPITQFNGKAGVRVICMRDKPRREIITGDNTGVITVWDLKS